MTDSADVSVAESEVERIESSEYEFSARAVAVLDGPDGRVRVERQYEALPYHNDDVEPEATDSNDSRMAPDEIHVHTKFYGVESDESTYVGDDHETWEPDDLAALGDANAFVVECTAHHTDDPARLYERVIAHVRD